MALQNQTFAEVCPKNHLTFRKL